MIRLVVLLSLGIFVVLTGHRGNSPAGTSPQAQHDTVAQAPVAVATRQAHGILPLTRPAARTVAQPATLIRAAFGDDTAAAAPVHSSAKTFSAPRPAARPTDLRTGIRRVPVSFASPLQRDLLQVQSADAPRH